MNNTGHVVVVQGNFPYNTTDDACIAKYVQYKLDVVYFHSKASEQAQ